MRWINRLLWRFGVQLYPRPASVKSLIEYANSAEVVRPMGPRAAGWIRSCALVTAPTDTDRHSATVRDFIERGGPACSEPSGRPGYGRCVLKSHERGPCVHRPEMLSDGGA